MKGVTVLLHVVLDSADSDHAVICHANIRSLTSNLNYPNLSVIVAHIFLSLFGRLQR